LKIEVKKKIDVIFDCRRGESVQNSFWGRNAIQIVKKILDAR